jgi:hypothetical protein
VLRVCLTPSVPERVVESPTPSLAGELEFSTLPAFEDCLDALDIERPASDGSYLGAVPIPLVSSVAVIVECLVSSSQLEWVVEPYVPERVLGKSPPHAGELEFSTLPAFEGWLGALDDGRPAEDGFASGAVLLKEPETTPPVSPQVASVVDFPLKEAQAEFGQNSTPAMGLLRWGFLGLRSPFRPLLHGAVKLLPLKIKGFRHQLMV